VILKKRKIVADHILFQLPNIETIESFIEKLNNNNVKISRIGSLYKLKFKQISIKSYPDMFEDIKNKFPCYIKTNILKVDQIISGH
jgi:hypothetical protein